MENTIKSWVKNNNILSFKIKKGGENVYSSKFSNTDDCADGLTDAYGSLQDGNYKILGSESPNCNESNSVCLPLTKTSTQMVNPQNIAGQKLYTEEQLNDKLLIQKKEMQIENLEKRVDKLETICENLLSDNRKFKEAIKILSDDNEENDGKGVEKLMELAQVGKSLMEDFKL